MAARGVAPAPLSPTPCSCRPAFLPWWRPSAAAWSPVAAMPPALPLAAAAAGSLCTSLRGCSASPSPFAVPAAAAGVLAPAWDAEGAAAEAGWVGPTTASARASAAATWASRLRSERCSEELPAAASSCCGCLAFLPAGRAAFLTAPAACSPPAAPTSLAAGRFCCCLGAGLSAGRGLLPPASRAAGAAGDAGGEKNAGALRDRARRREGTAFSSRCSCRAISSSDITRPIFGPSPLVALSGAASRPLASGGPAPAPPSSANMPPCLRWLIARTDPHLQPSGLQGSRAAARLVHAGQLACEGNGRAPGHGSPLWALCGVSGSMRSRAGAQWRVRGKIASSITRRAASTTIRPR